MFLALGRLINVVCVVYTLKEIGSIIYSFYNKNDSKSLTEEEIRQKFSAQYKKSHSTLPPEWILKTVVESFKQPTFQEQMNSIIEEMQPTLDALEIEAAKKVDFLATKSQDLLETAWGAQAQNINNLTEEFSKNLNYWQENFQIEFSKMFDKNFPNVSNNEEKIDDKKD